MSTLLDKHADYIQRFNDMAERIKLNDPAQFGGAFVIIAPGEEPVILSTLILDAAMDPVIFWSTLKTKCDIALQDLQMRQQGASAQFAARR